MRVPWQNQGPDYSYKNTDQLGVEDRLPKTNAVEALLSLPSHWCFKSPPPSNLGHGTSCNKCCCTLANVLLGSNLIKICLTISLPIFSQLAALRIERWEWLIYTDATLMTFSNNISHRACEPWQIVLAHCTLADKAGQNILRSSTVRYHPISSDLVADSSEFTAH